MGDFAEETLFSLCVCFFMQQLRKVNRSCFPQLIFRKVSDLKKEKELAERRKNDPALNQTQDHLVRKLFSKFKRGPSTSTPTTDVAADR